MCHYKYFQLECTSTNDCPTEDSVCSPFTTQGSTVTTNLCTWSIDDIAEVSMSDQVECITCPWYGFDVRHYAFCMVIEMSDR